MSSPYNIILFVLSRNKVLTTKEYDYVKSIQIMKKLTNRGMRWTIRQARKREQSVYRIAKQQNITPRHVRRLRRKYQDTPDYLINQISLRRPGKKLKPLNEYERKIILDTYEKMPMGAVKMEKYHELLGIPRIPHNRVQRILTEAGLTKSIGKKVKRKNWVRYARPHSNDLWHADYTDTEDGKHVIAYIDDASRKVVGRGKFNNATTENALFVLDNAISEWGIPKQVMTDHGTQFCTNDEKEYRFREELKKRGIEHIMSRVKRPQSNGKIERWFGSTDKLYKHFGFDLDKVVECYNNMPHLSLDTTPNIAYFEKMTRKMENTLLHI